MAFIYTLTNAAVTGTDPAGTDLISLGDDNIRNFKSAMIERINSRFADVNSDPWIMKSPAGGSGNVQSVIPVTDNLYTLGEAARRWSDVRAVLGTFGTLAGGTLTATSLVITASSGVTPLAAIGINAISRFSRNEAAFGGALLQFDRSGNVAGYIGMDASDNLTFQRGADAILSATINRATGVWTFASGIAGTLNTAAQPNVTSLGTVAGLTASGSPILTGATSGVNEQYVHFLNTGGDSFVGIERSTGGGIFAGSAAYATVLGMYTARSLQFFTNNTLRVTIDSAGNTVFGGTVTAANFVGPTSIDANNLTGTTINAGVIHSSLQDVGTLTSLTVSGNVNISNSNTSGLFFGAAGPRLRFQSAASQIEAVSNSGAALYDFAAATITAGTGFAGNLTGTVLTAAQANITSLGTLTGLTVNGIHNQGIDNTAGDKWIRIWRGNNPALANEQGHFWTATAGPSGIESASVGGRTVQLKNVGGQYLFLDDSGRVLVNTTSTTGTAAGGVHATGDSRFDALVSLVGTISTPLTVSGSHAAGTLMTLDNTAGSSRGSMIGFYKGGVLANYVGVEGVILGSTSGNLALWAELGLGIQFYTNGSTTPRMSIGSAGGVTFSSTVGGITTLTATSIFGTLATAAQTNVTSLGTLTGLTISGSINTTASQFIAASGQGTSGQYMSMANTGATVYFGIERSIGGGLFGGSAAYAGVLGTVTATSLQLYTNSALRLTIDSAGAGNFGGTLTAGAFSGPLTGNVTGNLTGTVLTAAQANITSLGTLTSLTVTGDVRAGTHSIANNVQGFVGRNAANSADVTICYVTSTDYVSLGVNSDVVLGVSSKKMGFFGNGGAVKASVTGSKGGNAALGSLLSALSSYGLVTDSST